MQADSPSARALLETLAAEAAGRAHRRQPLALSGLRGGGKGLLLGALAARLDVPVVVISPGTGQAEALADDVAFYRPPAGGEAGAPLPVHLFPHWDTVPYDGFSPHKDIIGQRFQALDALLAGGPRVLASTAQAWLQGLMPAAEFRRLRFEVRVGGHYPRGELLERLGEAGYVRVDLVEAPGEFSARGEIVDVFPIQSEHPVRLDFFDEELETLRLFEVGSQKSFESLEAVVLYPASEGAINARTAERARRTLPLYKAQIQPESYRQLWRYLEQGTPFPGYEQMLGLFYERASWLHEVVPDDAVLVLDEPERVDETAEAFFGEVLGEHELNLRQGNLALPPEHFYLRPGDWRAALRRRYRVEARALRVEEGGAGNLVCPFADNAGLRADGAATHVHNALAGVVEHLRAWHRAGAHVLLAARSETGAERLRHLLAEFELGVAVQHPEPGGFPALLAGAAEAAGDGGGGGVPDITALTRTPAHGFRLVDDAGATRLAVVTEAELLGEKTRQRRLSKSKLQHFLASLGELKEGDLVVHVEYGIGRYDGLRKLRVGGEEGEEGDFLVLHYAGDDKVYVPVYKFNQVQKYTGVEGAAPQLNRLGDGVWQRAKARASRAIEDMAEELVEIYAARRARKGTAFAPHEGPMAEFSEAFPFQETEDQERSIEEVLGDMTREEPMDRLVCGDVGFGKTEVAMRAAYLAVLEGRQVLMLVPTTILAQQHYDTFSERMGEFAVNVDVISRFRTQREQKQIVQAFERGEIDVLIGTHRLLSRDIRPANLGLLVIDEEQRFGVRHKEKLKQLKMQVDVLTLSATPIPRTLHMSLMGVRDLSVINTPPMDRVAVRTRLVKASDYIITEAVEREVRRGGRVFLVHNRVETIHQLGNYVRGLLPHLRIAIAHGQMPEKQLEDVMLGFVRGEVDVLLSTTIIESGLDIPRANTIIVNNADAFGLAQLYQLRGRVGRSNVQAYAYLLVSPEKVLTDVAQKRLTLLQELNDLGSGFKIASHDLEIRGAGNLLGREQSGHINLVGLELFTQMVEEAIARLKGEELLTPQTAETRIDLGFPYLLPEDYIASTQQRLDIYKQLAEVRGEDAVWELRQTIEDRFGRVPREVDNLITLIRVRLLAARYGLAAVENAGGQLQARFGRPELIDVERLMKLVNNPAKGFRLQPDDRLVLGPMPEGPEGVLERLQELEDVVRSARAA